MFERLTYKNAAGLGILQKLKIGDGSHEKCSTICREHGASCIGCPILDGITRLAAYEDSGLSPEEVQKMARAKAEGRLVVLPYKVGNPIYWFWTDGEGNPEGDVEEETVLYFYIDKDGLGIATKFHDGHIGHVKDGELVDGVRKIFLSREAAEKALGGKE